MVCEENAHACTEKEEEEEVVVAAVVGVVRRPRRSKSLSAVDIEFGILQVL